MARDSITARWREKVYDRWPPDATRSAGTMTWQPALREHTYTVRPVATKRPKVSVVTAAVSCAWCGGAWLAAVATAVVDASVGLPMPVAWWLAVSAAVGLLGRADAA